MCGKCGVTKGRVACGIKLLGVVAMGLAAFGKIQSANLLGFGPRTWAETAGLLLLLSIAINVCRGCGGCCCCGCCDDGECSCCSDEHHEEKEKGKRKSH